MILAAFVPPPGATRLSSAPGGVGGKLNGPEFRLGDPDVVGDGAWWHVPGLTPLQMLAWEQAHLPHKFTRGMVSGEAAPTPPKLPDGRTFPVMPYHYAAYGFNLPPVAGVLTLRELDVQAAMTDAGQTFVRVDSNVAWQPVRPASTYLPSNGIRVVVVTAVPGGNDRKKPPAPVTVTDPAKVKKLVALINAQPLFPPGTFACPFDDGRGVQLTFLAGTRGPAIATAFAKSNGCGGIQLTLHGKQTMLGWGPDVAQRALVISGMNWKLFGYLPM